jgi:hypothetical protein
MLCNTKIWHPLSLRIDSESAHLNRWQLLADMFNLASKLLDSYNQLDESILNIPDVQNYLSGIKLDEDLEIAGFAPLLNLPRDDYDNQVCISNLDSILKQLDESIVNRAKNRKRLKKLCLFAEFLCGLEDPVLKYDVINKCYSPILPTNSLKSVINAVKKCESKRTISVGSNNSSIKSSMIDDEESAKDEAYFFDQANMSDEKNLSELKDKRNKLKAKMDEQSKMENSHKSLLEMNTQRRIELEIRPKFIVIRLYSFYLYQLKFLFKFKSNNYFRYQTRTVLSII